MLLASNPRVAEGLFFFMYLIYEVIEFIWAIFLGLFSSSKQNIPDLRSRDILILPGFGAGAGFYRRLEKSLSKQGYRPYILPLPTWRSEKELIPHLTQALNASSDRMTLIAHNTAGLIVGGLPDSARRKVDTLISLGTPFRGFRLLNLFTPESWEPGSTNLEMRLPAYLFINRFHPLAPIQEYIFYPRDNNYGQGRDQWFDIPGNYNLVRRGENIRTLVDYVKTVNPPVPIPPKDTIILPDTVPQRTVVSRKVTPKKKASPKVKSSKKKPSNPAPKKKIKKR
jgi:hypothetical protein